MEYLLAHVDDEIPAASVGIPETQEQSTENKDPAEEKAAESSSTDEAAKSIKCEDCGRLFRTQLEVDCNNSWYL